MEKYEYMIIDEAASGAEYKGNPDNEFELNNLGDQGWELTAIRKSDSQYGGNRFYFKRRKQLVKND